MTTQLTDKEFRNTFGNRMIDVTATAAPILDIWPYVSQLNKQNVVPDIVLKKELVEYVYRTDTSLFDHVMLSAHESNLYIVIVVDLTKKVIEGHYHLNLNDKYAL